MTRFQNPRRAAARLVGVTCALILVVAGGVAGADPAFTSAHPVNGLATLNADGTAVVDDVSCSSNGNCGVVGTYTDSTRHVQGFVANEIAGVWGSAQPIPGLNALNAGGSVSDYIFISCTAATACTVGGLYTDAGAVHQAFVADEVQGSWNSAIELPRSSSLPVGLPADVTAVACTSPGNCVATGDYLNGAQTAVDVFVATETGGTWAGAVPEPGEGSLNVGQISGSESIACPAAGACQLTGIYTDGAGHVQGYVASEVNGTWGNAIAIPGLAGLNTGGVAAATQIACSSVGRCAVGGGYSLVGGVGEAFVDDEVGGTWATAQELPASATLNVGGDALLYSIACPSDGSCEAVGYYSDGATTNQAMVASETNGTWGNAAEMPGTAELNGGGGASGFSVSCVSAGDCRAVGAYTDSSNNTQSFLATESGGVWNNATEADGSAALNVEGVSALYVVSCTSDGGCSAGGQYKDAAGSLQGMIIDAATPPPPPATAPAAPTAKAASHAKGKLTVTVKPGADGGSSITSYQYSLNGGAWKHGSSGATTFTVSHQKSKAKVRVRVRAVNSVGTSPPSPSVTVKIK